MADMTDFSGIEDANNSIVAFNNSLGNVTQELEISQRIQRLFNYQIIRANLALVTFNRTLSRLMTGVNRSSPSGSTSNSGASSSQAAAQNQALLGSILSNTAATVTNTVAITANTAALRSLATVAASQIAATTTQIVQSGQAPSGNRGRVMFSPLPPSVTPMTSGGSSPSTKRELTEEQRAKRDLRNQRQREKAARKREAERQRTIDSEREKLDVIPLEFSTEPTIPVPLTRGDDSSPPTAPMSTAPTSSPEDLKWIEEEKKWDEEEQLVLSAKRQKNIDELSAKGLSPEDFEKRRNASEQSLQRASQKRRQQFLDEQAKKKMASAPATTPMTFPPAGGTVPMPGAPTTTPAPGGAPTTAPMPGGGSSSTSVPLAPAPITMPWTPDSVSVPMAPALPTAPMPAPPGSVPLAPAPGTMPMPPDPDSTPLPPLPPAPSKKGPPPVPPKKGPPPLPPPAPPVPVPPPVPPVPPPVPPPPVPPVPPSLPLPPPVPPPVPPPPVPPPVPPPPPPKPPKKTPPKKKPPAPKKKDDCCKILIPHLKANTAATIANTNATLKLIAALGKTPPPAPGGGGKGKGKKNEFLDGFSDVLDKISRAATVASASIMAMVAVADPSVMSTFTGSVKLLSAEIGSVFSPYVLAAAYGLQDLTKWVASFSDDTKSSVGRIGAWTLGIGLAIGTMRGLGSATGLTTLATWALTAAWRASPWGTVITGIAVLTYGLYEAAKAWGFLGDTAKEAGNKAKDGMEGINPAAPGGELEKMDFGQLKKAMGPEFQGQIDKALTKSGEERAKIFAEIEKTIQEKVQKGQQSIAERSAGDKQLESARKEFLAPYVKSLQENLDTIRAQQRNMNSFSSMWRYADGSDEKDYQNATDATRKAAAEAAAKRGLNLDLDIVNDVLNFSRNDKEGGRRVVSGTGSMGTSRGVKVEEFGIKQLTGQSNILKELFARIGVSGTEADQKHIKDFKSPVSAKFTDALSYREGVQLAALNKTDTETALAQRNLKELEGHTGLLKTISDQQATLIEALRSLNIIPVQP